MNKIKEIAQQVVEDDCWDMSDVFSDEELINLLAAIANKCREFGVYDFYLNADGKFCSSPEDADYSIIVRNKRGSSFVSWSDHETGCTGVSTYSEFPYFDDIYGELDEDLVRYIMRDLDEAYYNC